MLSLLRRFLRPTLREQLEDGVRDALRRYADRQTAPNLRTYISTDLIPDGVDHSPWARDEGEHLRRFALQWAEDNSVPRVGLRVEVILLDTKKEFAFVKPVGVEAPSDAAGGGAGGATSRAAAAGRPEPMVRGPASGTAVLEVVSSPSLTEAVRVTGDLTVGRKTEGDSVFGIGDRYMSSRHARFHLAGGKLYVTDLDSKNRTFVNDRPIPPHEQIPTAVGDQIRMGTTTLRVARLGS